MKVTLIKELFYLTKSKIYLVISGIIIGLLILGTFQASLNLKGAESLFVEDKQSDINFQKNIHKDYSISNNGNQSILNNATRYDYEQLNQANLVEPLMPTFSISGTNFCNTDLISPCNSASIFLFELNSIA